MDVVIDNLDTILGGFRTTVLLTLISGGIALVAGTLLAVMRVGPIPPLRWAGTAYVTLIRNTPLTLIFFFTTFGLPKLDFDMSFFTRAVVALSAYTSAFVCEVVRSGINSVAPGEIEASRSVGLNFPQTLRTVVLPQAFRSVIPPLNSTTTALAKNTAIAVAFSVFEATAILRRLQNQFASATFPLLISVAIGYLVITLTISGAFSLIERRVAIRR